MKLLGWSLRKSRKTVAAWSYCPLAKSARPRLKTSCSACEGVSSCCGARAVEAARTAAVKGAKTSAAASAAAPIRFHVLKVFSSDRQVRVLTGCPILNGRRRPATSCETLVQPRWIIQLRGRVGQGARRGERASAFYRGFYLRPLRGTSTRSPA